MIGFETQIAGKLNLKQAQVEAVVQLFREGATIPFIARYRKDRTGALDEVMIQRIQDEARILKEFTERRDTIIKSITEQGKMTAELQTKLGTATTLTELEDIYLPYKPRRKTRASVARENGLEPLADLLLKQDDHIRPTREAEAFVNEKVPAVEDALEGARDILAERFSEDITVRATLRKLFEVKALLQTTVVPGKETEAVKFRDYYAFSEPVDRIPSHRILAVLRGFLEGFLRLTISPREDEAVRFLEEMLVKGSNACAAQVAKAVHDSYKRLLQPGLETEIRAALKLRADEEAIRVFAENLRQLLLSSPLGSKRLLAIDPGYRTGCKTVCLDEKGDLRETSVFYIHEPGRLRDAENTIRSLCTRFDIQAMAIGDGTGGRETEQFIKKLELGLPVFLVNEDGASVYSASETAREEFPDQDLTFRGAVSIGRRLMDPLAELVKIDPKSIGVGQYQHDVNAFRLKERLDQTVISCVNLVGVNLNTASRHLLSYVSGINAGVAENIVKYRREIGRFTDRSQLKQIPRLGDKAFEQCAGFLRIQDGTNPLDASAVHPEVYPVVEKIAASMRVEIKDLIGNEPLLNGIEEKQFITAETGVHTIKDIIQELKKPGLDPRSEAKQFEFAAVYSLEDLKPGMVIPGIITNITRFGAFVDIGVKQDGLVHISEISHAYISDPSEKLKLNQQVRVKVLETDLARKRVSLSIRQATEPPAEQKKVRIPRADKKPGSQELKPLDMKDALAALKQKFGK